MEFKNQYGHVKLHHESNILIASFTGYINERLVVELSNAMLQRAKSFAGAPWGYISNSKNVQAATPEAEASFVALTKNMIKDGCIASAFIFDSSLIINQMQRVFKNAGLDFNIHNMLFSNLEEAKSFIEQKITEPTI
ncbi:MAG: hypothetical protein ACPG5Z_11950 [Pseudoalteromonas sp.]|uniref:hypothetical protein n=1 Tax=unclassified Pseudoalteromonas TaxID=194690 RepID=UPI000C068A4E|nr:MULTISPECIES: hypothetical protein [unclassified Pseudoalteromonas]MDP2633695.1 hypothetical protein [Pseudoalteromonas sp. 1_MG-2023]PHN89677.1 hypothetical protein CSC79_11815 [Pseudoalteromonas sp. 3D05]TGE81321.1 hypothetical protein C7Y70_13005 [Pseudoalteromonas sp. KS88]